MAYLRSSLRALALGPRAGLGASLAVVTLAALALPAADIAPALAKKNPGDKPAAGHGDKDASSKTKKPGKPGKPGKPADPGAEPGPGGEDPDSGEPPVAVPSKNPATGRPVGTRRPSKGTPLRPAQQSRTTGVRPPARVRRAPTLGSVIFPRPAGGGAGVGGASAEGAAPAAPLAADAGASSSATPLTDFSAAAGATSADGDSAGDGESPIGRTVRDIVEVVPGPLKAALAALAALSLMLGAGSVLTALRARRLEHQREELMRDVGLLQAALLPPVPDRVGGLRTSVAYRPAEGLAAGGDFYDALTLPGGRAAFILGDVSGHGRQALARTAFMRYTLRAYLEAGLEPRVALQVAGRVIDGNLDGDFATVVLAVHDPSSGTLTYASGGHPAPIVLTPEPFQPVLAASSPPIGTGLRTGLRQTSVPLPPGSSACLFTDGLAEARTEAGVLGRPRLADIVAGLGPDDSAEELIARVAAEARTTPDDMAAVLVRPAVDLTTGGFRTEQLELDADDFGAGLGTRFLNACGLDVEQVALARVESEAAVRDYGGAVLNVVFGNDGAQVDVLPRNVESLQAASTRSPAAVAGP